MEESQHKYYVCNKKQIAEINRMLNGDKNYKNMLVWNKIKLLAIKVFVPPQSGKNICAYTFDRKFILYT